nr:DUF3352 domain-containing protein [Acaryochloris sp. CCMEE 5410]
MFAAVPASEDTPAPSMLMVIGIKDKVEVLNFAIR